MRQEPSAFERIKLLQGDITKLAVDAIVNAANETLLGGGGVDGAIHRAAGPGLREECARLGGCSPGEAKITAGHDLPARHVIHTVGPRWRGGGAGEEETLAACYRNSLALAEMRGLETMAFPSISTGVFGFPIERAAPIALRNTLEWLEAHKLPVVVTFVAFSERDLAIYQAAHLQLRG
ncbi:MAG TPA: O-acetyl-ADP-ribose deacetylase [Opitutaceae bacterium]